MIKATELRIGNLVLNNEGALSKIVEISHIGTVLANNLEFWQSEVEFGQHCDQINPIPLTEEWLLKFGFKKDRLGAYLINDKYIIRPVQYGNPHVRNGINDLGFSFEFSDENNWIDLIRVKYVHVLQNLIFFLTNTELTIEDK